MRVRLFSDIGQSRQKLTKKIKTCMYTVCWGLNMTTYKRVKPATAGPVADTYFELKMLCLFHFALENEKNGHNVGTAVVPEKRFYFFPFYSFFFFLNFNSQCKLILGSIHSSVH